MCLYYRRYSLYAFIITLHIPLIVGIIEGIIYADIFGNYNKSEVQYMSVIPIGMYFTTGLVYYIIHRVHTTQTSMFTDLMFSAVFKDTRISRLYIDNIAFMYTIIFFSVDITLCSLNAMRYNVIFSAVCLMQIASIIGLFAVWFFKRVLIVMAYNTMLMAANDITNEERYKSDIYFYMIFHILCMCFTTDDVEHDIRYLRERV